MLTRLLITTVYFMGGFCFSYYFFLKSVSIAEPNIIMMEVSFWLCFSFALLTLASAGLGIMELNKVKV